ncbi:MAG: LysM peptidoglycan-binding domain-containing protein, partial [Oscillospiraceae bacterium]|nr:LysM peptidoglycan-binding domain-containing protein [Oscillospiraceae bacterium]
ATAAAATPTDIPTGDTVSYYLAQHVLQGGETVSGVCAALGVDFGKEDARIRAINNITNYNTMLPGKVLLLPVGTTPTTGSYYQVLAHTVAAGDTVYDLCTKYGLNFGTYTALIQRLNNRNDLSTFYPGQTLYMPRYVTSATAAGTAVPGAAGTGATAPASGAITPTVATTPIPVATPTPDGYTAPAAGATTTVPAGTTAGTGTAAAAAPATIPASDTLSYLVIPHVLQSGETVSGICAELGVDFMSNYDRIMQLSNIANYNYLLPGKVILVPSTTYPGSGPYYKIMAHTLVAGDTVYGLCTQYGLDYTSNAAFLQRLNNRNDLSTFYVGQTLYLPLYVAG